MLLRSPDVALLTLFSRTLLDIQPLCRAPSQLVAARHPPVMNQVHAEVEGHKTEENNSL